MHHEQSHLTRMVKALAVAGTLGAGQGAGAESLTLPGSGDDLVGSNRHVKAHHEDTLIDIARRYSVGQDEMMMANPTVDRWLPKEGTDVLLPKQYILPEAPRAGIVVNIPEMRMFYFPVRAAAAASRKSAPAPVGTGKTTAKPGAIPAPAKPKPSVTPAPATSFESSRTGEVITYPVSMGRMDWRTPIGKTSVVNKQKDPSWTPPASIKREHAAKGDPLPDVVPPGPDNPLGKYAMRLGVAGYLIHGTDAAKADGIGMRVTHGCMRMYNEDVAKLFPLVPVGAPVYLVNQPVKLGWQGNKLYMEISQPLDEDVGIPPHDVDDDISKEQQAREDAKRASFLMSLARTEIQRQKDKTGASVNMDKVRRAVERPTGIPVVIGGTGSGWEQAAESDEGLAPVAGKDDPNAGGLGVKAAPARRPPPKPTHIGGSGAVTSPAPTAYGAASGRAATRPYDAELVKDDASETLYSPDNPYRPERDASSESNGRPADAKSSPYAQGEDAPAPEPEALPVEPEEEP